MQAQMDDSMNKDGETPILIPQITVTNQEAIQKSFSSKSVNTTTKICRLCANWKDRVIDIFSEKGIHFELATKINLYLPIEVSLTDNLPLQCCWQCVSTILAWHQLVLTSRRADNLLRSYEMKIPVDKMIHNKQETNMLVNHLIESELINRRCNTGIIKNEGLIEPPPDNGIFSTDEIYRQQLSTYKIKYQTAESDKINDFNESKYKKSQSTFECSMCQIIYTSKSLLIEHIKLEHQILDTVEQQNKKEIKLKSEVKRSFSVKHMLKERRGKTKPEIIDKGKITVDGKIFYKCKECGKCLQSVYTYVWHMRIHTGERPYVCDLCGKQFRVSQGLVRHLKETHQRIKNFNCDICGRYFSTKRNVEEHRRIHTNERPYVCALCGKSFKQKASLFVHNRSHSTEFPFTCTYCIQKFRTKQSLLTHITRHTGEKPYPCDMCPRQFRIKYELKRHKLVHSEERPFNCTVCKQTFRQKRYLKNHLKLNHHVANPNDVVD